MKSVWTIAGSDSGGGAGIQADLNTLMDYAVHGATVITAITAQNTGSVIAIEAASVEMVQAQLTALQEDILPQAIKLGMLYDAALIEAVADKLSTLSIPIIADPVLISTTGGALSSEGMIQTYLSKILPLAALITPNVHEAEALTGIMITDFSSMEKAAEDLLSKGAKAVLLKGGDLCGASLASDYYADQDQGFWLNQDRHPTPHTHGTGCSLSAAIAAGLAQGWSLIDALVLAKAYVHAGLSQPRLIGQARNPIGHPGLADLKSHFPWITESPAPLPPAHPPIHDPIGPYPIVDNLDQLRTLCTKGISFIQFRVKNPGPDFVQQSREAMSIAQSMGVTLVINDHAEIASQIKAPALHLGQEDLVPVSRDLILGISAHSLFELARAYAYHPSYLAMGPIFKTQSKKMDYPEIGLEKLAQIASLAPLPLVAIGGIAYDQIPAVLALGCSGVAFIGASKELMNEGRYDRHFSLPGFSLKHQQQLRHSRVVCIGTGGLAAGSLPYLAAAGVGSITLIDHDRVSYSNLQRQVLFQEKDLGKNKVDVAAAHLRGLNSQIQILPQAEKLSLDNAPDLLQGYDLILDGTDNYKAHYLINDIARLFNIPLIAASVYQQSGQFYYFSPQSACYRCAFPEAPAIHERPNCSEAGILGTTPAIFGLMQAQLAIDLLSGNPAPETSLCRTLDMKTWAMKQFTLPRDPQCPCCDPDLSLTQLRSMHMTAPLKDISVENLKALIDAGVEVHLLDVRENEERAEFNIGGLHIPIQVLPERINELNDRLTYLVYCRSGGRSRMACEFLAGQGFQVQNLAGGMMAWLQAYP
jgi:hydroxymethylpyrimidine kinase/phosphomethylpyrimidine kinase/thiamine-phosphate diphosphorylase